METTCSVIIPAFNANKTIIDTLKSIESQKKLPDEILIGIDACQDTFIKLKEAISSLSISDRIMMFWFEENV